MSSPSYAAVLRTPLAARTFAAALLGRLSYGMVSLSLMLAVKEATGSYAAAGSCVALFGVTSVFLSPVRAGLIDRYGPRRALPPMAGVYAVLLGALGVVTAGGAAGAGGLAAMAAAAGACTPPLGPVMRVLWSELVPERLVSRAYSLDAVAEELLLVAGPLLVGLVVGVASPAAGLGVSAGLVLSGTLALTASPAARLPRRAPRAPEAGRPPGSGALRRNPALRRAVVGVAGVGVCLGALELLAVAFADEHDAPGLVPWIALNAGASSATAATGLLIGRVPLPLCFALAALPALLFATGIALTPSPRKTSRPSPGAGPSGA